MTTRQPAFASAVLAFFSQRTAEPIEVPILQPADPFLDIAGEDLRRRIFLTESETGEALCLRPEFTIPVCLDHIRSRAGTPRRYAYLGEVFRQQRTAGNEFFQAGIEDLGDPNVAEADARLIGDAYAMLDLLLPGREVVVTIGDQTLFEAVLAGLGLPRGWQRRLARAFGSPDQLAGALADLAEPKQVSIFDETVAPLVASGDRVALAAHIAERMQRAGFSPVSGRTPEDIARRLFEKAELSQVRLPREAFEALRSFLGIHIPLSSAADELERFAKASGLELGKARDDFLARIGALEGQGLALDRMTYDAAFGRPLDYYTGLVFEISAAGGERPLIGGGRYDRLLTLLGASHPIPGVGFSVWLDRIAGLQERAS